MIKNVLGEYGRTLRYASLATGELGNYIECVVRELKFKRDRYDQELHN